MGKEIYALEELDITRHSVFLAGPTPRNHASLSWRPTMISVLRNNGYEGDILIPEKRGNYLDYEYETETRWEVSALNKSSQIFFWIPRELEKMPAFTTNIEFGEFLHSGKIILGYPTWATKMRYLQVRAEMHEIPVVNHMVDFIKHIDFIKVTK